MMKTLLLVLVISMLATVPSVFAQNPERPASVKQAEDLLRALDKLKTTSAPQGQPALDAPVDGKKPTVDEGEAPDLMPEITRRYNELISRAKRTTSDIEKHLLADDEPSVPRSAPSVSPRLAATTDGPTTKNQPFPGDDASELRALIVRIRALVDQLDSLTTTRR